MNNFSKLSIIIMSILLFSSLALTSASAASNSSAVYSRMTNGVLTSSNSTIAWNQTVILTESFQGGVAPFKYQFGVFEGNGKLLASYRVTSNSPVASYNFQLSANTVYSGKLHVIAVVSDSPSIGDSIQSQNSITILASPIVPAVAPASTTVQQTQTTNTVVQTPTTSQQSASTTPTSLIVQGGIIALTILGIVFVGIGIYGKEKAKRNGKKS